MKIKKIAEIPKSANKICQKCKLHISKCTCNNKKRGFSNVLESAKKQQRN